MPNPSLTELVVILDRSGSMSTIQNDMIGGFASLMKDQAAQPGACLVSLYMFDNQYDTVYEECPVADVGKLPLKPRGATALLDAIGTTVLKTGLRYSRKAEALRPGKVVVVIITDGHENASSEFTAAQIKEMVETQTRDYAWQFVYLAANVDTFATGQAMGMQTQSSRGYQANAQGVARAYGAVSNALSKYRSSAGGSAAGQSLSFDPEDE